MKFITSEQFLKADTKVQNAILKWWKPSVGDLYCNLYNNQRRNVFSVDKTQLSFKTFADDIKLYGVPLLTVGQLIEFIEEITNSIVLTEFMFSTKDYSIICFENEKEYKYLFDNLGDDLLQALWQVVCEIILNTN